MNALLKMNESLLFEPLFIISNEKVKRFQIKANSVANQNKNLLGSFIDFSNININMLSGNPTYLQVQPISQNPAFRTSINLHTDQQSLKFYHPSTNQLSSQFHSNIPKNNQVKNNSQSFSTSVLPKYQVKNSPVHNQDFLRIPKRIPTEGNINDNSLQENSTKKKTFFLKMDGLKNQKNNPRMSELVQSKNITTQIVSQHKKQQNIDQGTQKRKFFPNRDKSPINRNKTQQFPARNKNIHRVSQTPISFHKQGDKFYSQNLDEANIKQQKKNYDKNQKPVQNIFIQSFGPTKKNQLMPNNQNGTRNSRTKSNLSVTPIKQNKKSTTNLKFSDKPQKPSFFPSKKSITKFHIVKQIGVSKFSESFLCIQKKTYGVFCVKKIKKSLINQSPSLLNQFIRKISLQFKSIHPNIIQIYDVFCDSEYVYLVQQYMEGGNLRDFLNKKKHIQVQHSIVQKIFNINSALYYIHNHDHDRRIFQDKSNPTIHGDLRPQTILMNLRTCKISPVNPIKIEKTISQVHCYVCPQALAQQVLTPKSDIWNLGLVLYQLCSHKNLFKVKSNQYDLSLTDQIINMNFNDEISILPQASNQLKQLLKNLLRIRPDQRMSSEQIMTSNVIKIHGIKTDDFEQKKHKIPHSQMQKIKIGPKYHQYHSKQSYFQNRYSVKRENVNGKQFNIIYNN